MGPTLLIGMFDSPFVRRVAVSASLLGIPFEHRSWSVGKDFDKIREYNPLGRVPTWVLPEGEALVESAMILDYLDDSVGAERALLPRSGAPRREALRVMAIAIGAAEKGVLQLYEKAFRPEEKRHEPWLARCRLQVHGALMELERLLAPRHSGWFVGEAMTQADITAACVYFFLRQALALDPDASLYPSLCRFSERCEALPAFLAYRLNFFAPG